MTEAELKQLIEDTLAIPVFEGKDTIVYPGATLEVLQLNPALFGDGKCVMREADAEINLWYKDKAGRDDAVQDLLIAMDSQPGITSPDVETYYDTTAKKYRAIIKTVYRYPVQSVPVSVYEQLTDNKGGLKEWDTALM